MNFDILTPEEKFDYGSWLYYVQQGWVDPNWWDEHEELAKATGHVLDMRHDQLTQEIAMLESFKSRIKNLAGLAE